MDNNILSFALNSMIYALIIFIIVSFFLVIGFKLYKKSLNKGSLVNITNISSNLIEGNPKLDVPEYHTELLKKEDETVYTLTITKKDASKYTYANRHSREDFDYLIKWFSSFRSETNPFMFRDGCHVLVRSEIDVIKVEVSNEPITE